MRVYIISIKILLFLLIPYSSNCQKYSLQGQFENEIPDNHTVYLLQIKTPKDFYNGSSALVIDSASIDKKGFFEFANFHALDSNYVYRMNLVRKGENPGMINRDYAQNNYVFLVNEQDDILFKFSSGKNFSKDYKIVSKGESIESRQFLELSKLEYPIYKATETFLKSSSEGDSLQIANARDTYFEFMRHFVVEDLFPKYLEELKGKPSTAVSSFLLSQFIEIKDINEHLDFYVQFVENFVAEDEKHPYAIWWNNTLDQNRSKLTIGDVAPNVVMKSLDTSNNLSLYETKGKLILLDFWASWCTPCRKENIETVKPLYEKYHSEGFEVFGVSFDKKQSKLQSAIEADKLSWTSVCDFLGQASPIWKRFQISSLPTTYLLNENFEIIETNIRGQELEKFVHDYLDD